MATYLPAPQSAAVPIFSSNPFVTGFNMAVTGNTTFTLTPGAARAMTSDFVISYPSYSANLPALITVDVSTVGANGCFPVALASLGLGLQTQFPVYIIEKSSGTTDGSLNPAVNAVCVVATGNNFLPAGYDAFRRIGWVYIDDVTLHILPMTQSGNGNERTYVLQDPLTPVSGGNATAQTVVDLTINDGAVPAIPNVKVLLNVEIAPSAANGYVCVEPGNATAASLAPVEIIGSVAAVKNSSYVEMISTPNATTGNAEIKYFVDNAGSAATINVVGFEDSLGNTLV